MPNLTVTASAHQHHKDITLISAKGIIDTVTASEFDKTFQTVLSQKKFNLIVDLKDVNYISSAGWGIFIAELKRIRAQRGNLFLVSMTPSVTDTFHLLEFHTILKSFPDVEQAVLNGFGKTRADKGNGKRRTKKDVDQFQAQEMPMEQWVEPALQETLTFRKPQKPHWFKRILKPWRWF